MSDGEGDMGNKTGNHRSPSPDGEAAVPGPYNGNGKAMPESVAHGGLSGTGAPASIHDAFASSYRNLYDKLAAAWNAVEIRQAIAEADHELQRRLAALSSPGQELERCEVMVQYLQTVRQLGAPERHMAKIAFAYSRYIDEVRDIWSRPDIHSIEPHELSAFGESIAWAGYFASLRP
ncbi:hypothetical protein [Burkholderia ubonensis]|uniref:hypothetical protein n=1 Tax=Burkholderia ubonensis TaxID=101571 RepID=UPI002AAF9674|nr:hypothetical protein [Burkholderia ubonensis]